MDLMAMTGRELRFEGSFPQFRQTYRDSPGDS
jgi:hypothetical protein